MEILSSDDQTSISHLYDDYIAVRWGGGEGGLLGIEEDENLAEFFEEGE